MVLWDQVSLVHAVGHNSFTFVWARNLGQYHSRYVRPHLLHIIQNSWHPLRGLSHSVITFGGATSPNVLTAPLHSSSRHNRPRQIERTFKILLLEVERKSFLILVEKVPDLLHSAANSERLALITARSTPLPQATSGEKLANGWQRSSCGSERCRPYRRYLQVSSNWTEKVYFWFQT